MAVVGIAPEILHPDGKHARVERNQDHDDRPAEHAHPKPAIDSFADLVASIGRKTHRIFAHRAPAAGRTGVRRAGARPWSSAGRFVVKMGIYLSSAKTFFASSFPAKVVDELTATVKAARAPSLSPTFRDANPRWY